MRILVIGSGGRECAIVWKLKQSPLVEKIYCSPGNGGIASIADCIPACNEKDWSSYLQFVQEKKIDLTIVGPEAPLAEGIVDAFQQKNLSIVGLNRYCAQLESSKIFAKKF